MQARVAAGIASGFSALFLHGCGVTAVSRGHAVAVKPVRGHAQVSVYLCSTLVCSRGATRRDERSVGARLRAEPCVRRVRFVSKAQALAQVRKKHPNLFKGPLLGNPLPDSFVVTPDHSSCAAKIAADIRAAHLRGVQAVRFRG